MSNRIFKLRMNNQQSIMFDYGIVEYLPQIANLELQQSAVCCVKQYVYIKQKGVNYWKQLNSKKVFKNITVGIDSYQYFFVNDFETIDFENYSNNSYSSNSVDSYNSLDFKKNIMILNHNMSNDDINICFKCYDESYQKMSQCFLPYLILSENLVAIDCTGFENMSLNIIIS